MEGHAVYVAEQSDGYAAGWVHVHTRELVVTDRQAEIGGLVVDESHRRHEVGRLLMERAEQWTREKGCGVIQLRSNVIRKDAHVFYERIGYSNVKAQLTFRQDL